ncbi:unnamed protein product [Arctogadus glacialis]
MHHHQQPGGPLPVVAALEKTPSAAPRSEAPGTPSVRPQTLLRRRFPWWKAPELECAEAVCADDYNTDEYTVGLGCGRWSQPRLGPSDMSMETDWFC